MIRTLVCALCLVVVAAVDAAATSRIKDIAILQGSRDNQLIGYGLVVGLQGTGDSLRNAPFTEQSMRSMLDTLGVATAEGRARLKNIAAVMVTANLPAFATSGARIDVTVSSLGDATSLGGGQLVMTPLLGADGQIYAVAQGSVSIAGFSAEGQAETVSQGTPTAGRIAGGAIVEREVPVNFSQEGAFLLQLRNPDFSTAVAVTDAINAHARQAFGAPVAKELDSRTVRLNKPDGMSPARFIAAIENLSVQTDQPARVVLDEKSGTVVIGADVRVSRVAVSHGALTVRITEAPTIIQPAPFSDGVTAVEPSTFIDVDEEGTQIGTIDGVDLQSLVEGLNRLGVQPRDVISILQAIKSAGALNAELVVQ
ncbi:MAG: flagellar basal body P-ring protein FlgI [Roseitalea sp.]|jgi:flagellar P-ring protein precursor FlgI|uniref:Flagellar P-ring protein n=1 Tax=Oceaniradius stylonematis TaxID=2184161 RepID=A0A3A8A9G6_9HYPH|nr:flagellar basal body P-ring protein FlgI [Oceaniradius stylonematis]MBO6553127.1 flagellar basal body P-ring protein FlgI [Roseitalea sp.]MBO6951113.1 flagellar basal body P-ring protein FlgI [Rhizobiaceae bacterium]MBO6590900.1 flagellar basal body P-ring protein FlgI [Roseitalea sp.]MBO6599842.1 flagellar basal body P-ring protein FlgI [Roseitalea sp.]MBO6611598.1 flagellar basal body P-ring protein FlgI [Roseitalea sp.]